MSQSNNARESIAKLWEDRPVEMLAIRESLRSSIDYVNQAPSKAIALKRIFPDEYIDSPEHAENLEWDLIHALELINIEK
jgi:hypothetical protein